MKVPGGTIEVVVSAKPKVLTSAQLVAWVEGTARAIAAYYGTFPVSFVDLEIQTGGSGRGIGGGRTQGGRRGASIEIALRDATTDADLMADWELTHEMVHLAFPSMPGRQSWIEEGLATYVEPIVRARAGRAKTEEIWRWLVWGLPQGQQALEGRGLDAARGHDAQYWGGALFCFLADVEIRKRTSNKASLDDALRAIVAKGGNVTVSWDLERSFAVADQATGVPVLTELYAQMRGPGATTDPTTVLKALGVSGTRNAVSFDEQAPLASIRHGIEKGS